MRSAVRMRIGRSLRAWVRPGLAALAAAFLGALAMAPSPGLALEPSERLENPALEARARDISAELRCLVCQNQSIDDSDAGLARDLRRLVRERLKAGDTDGEVKEFLVARYGEFVLLKPPFNSRTLLLWLAPILTLLLIVGYVVYRLRNRGSEALAATQQVPLSRDERARLDELISGGSPRNDQESDAPNGR